MATPETAHWQTARLSSHTLPFSASCFLPNKDKKNRGCGRHRKAKSLNLKGLQDALSRKEFARIYPYKRASVSVRCMAAASVPFMIWMWPGTAFYLWIGPLSNFLVCLLFYLFFCRLVVPPIAVLFLPVVQLMSVFAGVPVCHFFCVSVCVCAGLLNVCLVACVSACRPEALKNERLDLNYMYLASSLPDILCKQNRTNVWYFRQLHIQRTSTV